MLRYLKDENPQRTELYSNWKIAKKWKPILKILATAAFISDSAQL